jgi:regulator of sigma E protease
MISTIIIFILILGLLVLVHEFGHFWVAKKSGMKVLEFGFGFPPRAFGIQKQNGKWRMIWGSRAIESEEARLAKGEADNTIYSINWIPLGGFVKIFGENNEYETDPRSFINRPFWGRFLTLVAGVVMNIVLAWLLISIGFGLGLPAAVSDLSEVPSGAKFTEPKTAILEVEKDKPAEIAGLKPGDVIVSIDGKQFDSVDSVRNYIRQNSGQQLQFEVRRANEAKKFEVASKALSELGPEEGPTGIVLATLGKLSYPWHKAFYEGLRTTFSQIASIVTGLYRLISAGIGLDSLGGPVKIAQLTGQVADMGLPYLIQFTSFLSLNLAVLNILPFPALDGGRVLFLIIEKIRGKKNNQKIEQWANTLGFVLLLLLMFLVTIKDIRGIGN